MTGREFAVAKRVVAMFCVALCLALSVQMTIVVLDRMKHVFQIDHAPTALAGPVFDHGHHLKVEVRHVPHHSHDPAPAHGHEIAFGAAGAHGHDHSAAPGHAHDAPDMGHAHETPDVQHTHGGEAGFAGGFHTHDGLPQGHDHGSITHHHHGSGMLTPWLVSASLQLVALPVKIAVFEAGTAGHPDAPAWRRDRPPKPDLERLV